LGQPELAKALTRISQARVGSERADESDRNRVSFTFSVEEHPAEVLDRCLEAYSLQAVFGRDLVAAHHGNLLTLSGLGTPRHLDSIVVDPPRSDQPDSPWLLGWSQIQQASQRAGKWLLMDSPELLFAAHGMRWLEAVCAGRIGFRRHLVFNLRMATPPRWSNEVAAGPLFPASSATRTANHSGTLSILDAAESKRALWFLINWHMHAQDFEDETDSQAKEILLPRPALWRRTTFIFDRPGRPVALAAGLDRTQPAMLLSVGLQLDNFLRLPEVEGDTGRMLAKLPSLVRMAVSAGMQKRHYLRRHCPELSRGFLLDRARLSVEPWQLDEAAQRLVGAAPAQSKLALGVAQQISQTLSEAAEQESKTANLDISLVQDRLVDARTAEEVAAHIQTAGALTPVGHNGILRVVTPTLSADDLWRHLCVAWRTPGLAGIRFFPEQ